jgi:SAM-dependent methyltransferase
MPDGVVLNLVEPSEDLFERLKQRFEQMFPDERLRLINSDLQDFVTEDRFDVILMSHLFYHIPRAAWADQLEKALSLLKPTGVLVIVLREADDAYDFKMAFKPQLFDKSFKALTINDVLGDLPKDPQPQVTRHTAASELKIPFQENMEDTISIIEFYLNKPWGEIPESIREGALTFIKEKGGIFKQLDGIAVIKQP